MQHILRSGQPTHGFLALTLFSADLVWQSAAMSGPKVTLVAAKKQTEPSAQTSTTKDLVPLADGLARIAARVPTRVMDFLRHNTKHEPATATALFVSALGIEPAAATASIIVVEGALDTQELILSTRRLFGTQGQRNAFIFVFTDAVACDVVSTVPEVLAFFCRGLTARRLACFNGGDSDARIFEYLDAKVIISGNGSGSAWLEEGAVLRAERICGFVGTPKNNKQAVHDSGAIIFDDVGQLWPEVADSLDDQDPWELVQEHLAAGTLPF